MCDFKPGDEIECVASPAHTYRLARLTPPVVGAAYTVKAVLPCLWAGNGPDCDGLYLVELPEGDSGWAYAPQHFRKVERRTDTLSIESFLTIKPGQFEEPRRAPAKKRERV